MINELYGSIGSGWQSHRLPRTRGRHTDLLRFFVVSYRLRDVIARLFKPRRSSGLLRQPLDAEPDCQARPAESRGRTDGSQDVRVWVAHFKTRTLRNEFL